MSDFAMPRFGYRPRQSRLMDTQLKLDPMFMVGLPGWSLQTDAGRIVNLDLGLPVDWDDQLCRVCADFSRAMRLNPDQDPSAAARTSLLGLSSDSWDKLYGVARGLGPMTWPKLYGPGRNIVTGQPETIGSIDPDGFFERHRCHCRLRHQFALVAAWRLLAGQAVRLRERP